MSSWKTTTAGLVTALAGFIAFSPAWFHPLVVDIAKYIGIGGLAALGIFGKDKDAHSTAAEVQAATIEHEVKESQKETQK